MAISQYVMVGTLARNITHALVHPFKSSFSVALLLGSVAVQSIIGQHPLSSARQGLDAFIDAQTSISYNGLLCNIGPDGCHARGAAPGVVAASPSRQDPDYFYTWTRDSGLVFRCLIDILTEKFDPDLQVHIQNYLTSQSLLQGVSNPSGSLTNGEGLGEPKFHVDLSSFTGNWGRPQRDGPALRAITSIGYGKWLISNGYNKSAADIIWPMVSNDLSYVAQYWNSTGFDLWEEVEGSSFFTAASQHRALVEGQSFAQSLGELCEACVQVSPQILCFMRTFWSSDGYMLSNINSNSGRSERDANVLLASIHGFDPAAGCDAATFQPCSDQALASHKVIVDAFRPLYGINRGIPASFAVAIGRYPEDNYYGGNPWYLCTLAAAEQLYDAIHVWRRQRFVEITDTSLAFFKDHYPLATIGILNHGTPEYEAILEIITTYADGFLGIVAAHTPLDGSLAEQFHRDTGQPTSAKHLTWSYASFLTAARSRAGIFPTSWIGTSPPSPPEMCVVTSAKGTYSTATSTSFPGNETPIPETPPGNRPIELPAPSLCRITFEERVETHYGQTVKLVGDAIALGRWQPSSGIPLDASDYTADRPHWKVALSLTPGKKIQYKYIVVDVDGSVTWESDPNHSYTVPLSCEHGAGKHDRWQA